MPDANPVKVKEKPGLAGPVGFVGRLSPRTHDLRVKSHGTAVRWAYYVCCCVFLSFFVECFGGVGVLRESFEQLVCYY